MTRCEAKWEGDGLRTTPVDASKKQMTPKNLYPTPHEGSGPTHGTWSINGVPYTYFYVDWSDDTLTFNGPDDRLTSELEKIDMVAVPSLNRQGDRVGWLNSFPIDKMEQTEFGIRLHLGNPIPLSAATIDVLEQALRK